MRNIYKKITGGDPKRILGILSGTSADGASLALVDIWGGGKDLEIELVGHQSYRYPNCLREKIFTLFSPNKSRVDLICKMNFVLGAFFADCIKRFIGDEGLERVDLIGSHGQTIWHSPRPGRLAGYPASSTLQIGEPAVIAERTGIPVVADFRKADIAASGEGAPLTPYLDYVAFKCKEKSIVIQNIGGIANLTYLPASPSIEDVIAFDTGPGNMIIDYIIRHYTGGRGGLRC
ncbi:MAG: anhydro-N-acetylmuramic acid kinase [Candidatus Bathyarchaeia archaeon]